MNYYTHFTDEKIEHKVNNLPRMYIVDKWWIWDLNTANMAQESVHLTTMLYFLSE